MDRVSIKGFSTKEVNDSLRKPLPTVKRYSSTMFADSAISGGTDLDLNIKIDLYDRVMTSARL